MLNDVIARSGVSRREWAARLDVSEAYLSQLCTGVKTPSLALAFRIERETGGVVAAASWLARVRPDAPSERSTA